MTQNWSCHFSYQIVLFPMAVPCHGQCVCGAPRSSSLPLPLNTTLPLTAKYRESYLGFTGQRWKKGSREGKIYCALQND